MNLNHRSEDNADIEREEEATSDDETDNMHHGEEHGAAEINNDHDEDEEDEDEEQRQLLIFRKQCERAEANELHFTRFDTRPFRVDDTMAVQLGRSLFQNTRLTELLLHPNDVMTAREASTLWYWAYKFACYTSILLPRNDQVPIVMAPLYTQPTNTKHLGLFFPFDDAHALQLSLVSLRNCQALEKISIIVCRLLTPSLGGKALAQAIRASITLTTLDLMVDPDGGNANVAQNMQQLWQAIHDSSSIQNIDVYGMIGNLQTLPTLSNLVRLKVCCPELSQLSNLQHFCKAVLQPPSCKLELLGLRNCGLRDEHMRILTRSGGIGNHPSLKELQITQNTFLGDDSVATFLQHWHEDSKLWKLHLTGSRIGPRVAQRLVRATSHHPKFNQLDLSDNDSIGYDGLSLIGQELPRTTLETLCLNRVATWIDYDDVDSKDAILQRTKQAQASRALLDGVHGNVHVMDLDLGEVILIPSIMAELEVYLEANRCGRSLLAEQDTLPPAIWSHFLSNSFIDSPSVVFVLLRELPVVFGGTNSSMDRKSNEAPPP